MTFTVPFMQGKGVEAAASRYITDRFKEQNPGVEDFSFDKLPVGMQHTLKEQFLPVANAMMPHAALEVLVALRDHLADVPLEEREAKLNEVIMDLQLQFMF